jgi:hypothetical protein
VTDTPWNLLCFCDIAVLVTVAGIWMECPSLLSVQAFGIVLPPMVRVAMPAVHAVGQASLGVVIAAGSSVCRVRRL